MKNSAVAIGTFDGFHLGHKYLVSKLIEIAKARSLKSVVVTLSRPVKQVEGILTTLEEKSGILAGLPVDEIVILPVKPEIINQPAWTFFSEYLQGRLSARHLVVGQNFAFGHQRQGTVQWLKSAGARLGVEIDVVRPVCHQNTVISSTLIRKMLLEGRIEQSNKLLGRFFHFEGPAEKGRAIGRKIGVPTINISIDQDKLLPLGVFVVMVEGEKKLHPGVLNIGSKPTFFSEGKVIPEVHLLDFKGRWRANRTKVYLLSRLREEKRFSNIGDLKNQINNDIKKAKVFFGLSK
ncbi:MAG: riboflavin biosynthesis protein RibF [Endomicrobiales bacterium]|nr:riboflavin biosynthesis protein RibF [Endomicrobiales bacterium]